MKIIFLISLPRSGSTLLQKILMTHDEIASSPECWFVLPLLYSMKENGIKTEYGQKSASIALSNLKSKYFKDKNIYEKQLKNFIQNIYLNIKNEEKYFLDKTPRYYWILDDLKAIFPEAKFIILQRNPISIFSSTIEAFSKNKIKRLDHYYNDFYIGPQCISNFLDKYGDDKNTFITSYEDIVNRSEEIQNICKFLDIEFDTKMINKFSNIKLQGYGDHLGAKRLTTIVNNSEKWKTIINTHLRKSLLLEYLDKYDEKYLNYMKLEKKILLSDIEKFKPKSIGLNELKDFLEYKLIVFIKKIINFKSFY